MTAPYTDDDVSVRLRRVRDAFGLSQRRLSERSGVSNATISQIEAGLLNPTVGMLKKILSGIPMSLSEFFTHDADKEEARIFFTAADLVEISKGGVSYRQVGGRLRDRAIQLMTERYEAGASTGRHPLKHEGEECGFVLSGEITVTVDGQTRTLKAGDGYYFKSDAPHKFQNDGDAPCELISACTPPTF